MKQKQKPVVLVSILVVAVIGIGLTNNTDIWASVFAERKAAPKDEGKTGEKVTAEEKAQLAAQVKSKRPASGPKEPGDEEAEVSVPEVPSILSPKITYQKPQHNETATSQQWYREGSGTEVRAKALNDKRGG